MGRKRLEEILGGRKQFGRLRVLGDGHPYIQPNGKVIRRARCECTCGKIVDVITHYLRTSRTESCGCKIREKTGARSQTHGETVGRKPSPEYQAWSSMISRCECPSNIMFHRYGGRGISVCELWRHSFPEFLKEVGRRPSPKHSLDRIRFNGNYEPGNVRWATDQEQAVNRCTTRLVPVDGRMLTINDAAKKVGLKPATLSYRLRAGMSPEEALSWPLGKRRTIYYG